MEDLVGGRKEGRRRRKEGREGGRKEITSSVFFFGRSEVEEETDGFGLSSGVSTYTCKDEK